MAWDGQGHMARPGGHSFGTGCCPARPSFPPRPALMGNSGHCLIEQGRVWFHFLLCHGVGWYQAQLASWGGHQEAGGQLGLSQSTTCALALLPAGSGAGPQGLQKCPYPPLPPALHSGEPQVRKPAGFEMVLLAMRSPQPRHVPSPQS